MILVIGNKTYSSWSLRPWLLMKHFEIAFDEILIKLDMPDTAAQIQKYSPAGKVPVLIDDKITIWDSLAIAEYLNEKYPDRQMWPKDPAHRARARSVSAEMHSGFQTMRSTMSHHLRKTVKNFDWSEAKNDVTRVKTIWRDCLAQSGGPFLFGNFSIADAMYAPVVNRFVTYDIPLEKEIEPYMQVIRNLPAHQAWIQAARKEDFDVALH